MTTQHVSLDFDCFVREITQINDFNLQYVSMYFGGRHVYVRLNAKGLKDGYRSIFSTSSRSDIKVGSIIFGCDGNYFYVIRETDKFSTAVTEQIADKFEALCAQLDLIFDR